MGWKITRVPRWIPWGEALNLKEDVCCLSAAREWGMLKATKIHQGWGHIKYGSLNNIMDN
jgi:hypothetical protein